LNTFFRPPRARVFPTTITVVFQTVKRDHFFSPTPELLLDLKRLERSEAIERLERLEPAAAVGERSGGTFGTSVSLLELLNLELLNPPA
jgi:hypothetical protein